MEKSGCEIYQSNENILLFCPLILVENDTTDFGIKYILLRTTSYLDSLYLRHSKNVNRDI